MRSHSSPPSVASVQRAAKGGVFRCPNADCSFAFLCPAQLAPPVDAAPASVDADADAAAPSLLHCPACTHAMCAHCLGAAHVDQTCAEVDARRAAEIGALLAAVRACSADGGAQQCPSCGHAAERTEGCDFMKCLCGNAFCYQCGDALNRNYLPLDEEARSCACGAFQR